MQTIYAGLAHMGVPPDAHVLEPGCGIGNFMGLAPAEMDREAQAQPVGRRAQALEQLGRGARQAVRAAQRAARQLDER